MHLLNFSALKFPFYHAIFILNRYNLQLWNKNNILTFFTMTSVPFVTSGHFPTIKNKSTYIAIFKAHVNTILEHYRLNYNKTSYNIVTSKSQVILFIKNTRCHYNICELTRRSNRRASPTGTPPSWCCNNTVFQRSWHALTNLHMSAKLAFEPTCTKHKLKLLHFLRNS